MRKVRYTIEELSVVSENRKLYCYGCGDYLINTLFGGTLSEYHLEQKVSLIIDNDPQKYGTDLRIMDCSIPICSFDQVKDRVDVTTIIVISSLYRYEEIEKQLCNLLDDVDAEYSILVNDMFLYREDDKIGDIIKNNRNLKQRIPKTIHWCWFGGNELPKTLNKCLDSWKIKCADYEIIEWNEKTFDISSNVFVKEAYEKKKYAFVTDYVRLWCIYNFGGIYLDSDVEVLKELDSFLGHSAFSGFEDRFYIPTGIMGGEKGNSWYEYLLSYYDNRHFVTEKGLDLTTNCVIISKMTFAKFGHAFMNGYHDFKDVTFYPQEVFCPINLTTKELNTTKNTHCIHWFSGSWIK